jgi:hypothetical protein
VVFDIDSTLLDNRPRQAQIFRDFAVQYGVPELAQAEPHHWQSQDPRGALRHLGLEGSRLESILPKLKDFWQERFFTSEYCRRDVPIAGAAEFVLAVAHAGAQIVYLTGRHEGMRPGTIDTLSRYDFPLPPGNSPSVHLIMKPSVGECDDMYKRSVHAHVRRLGRLIAAFDNEPSHVNDFAESFPDAIVVHLNTDDSGRPIVVGHGIPSIQDFLRGHGR